MHAIIYLLCTATSLICCVLLLRGYRRNRVPLLLWSGLCFGALSVENLLLFLDRVVLPMSDLSSWRVPFGLIGVFFLLHGLIWKNK